MWNKLGSKGVLTSWIKLKFAEILFKYHSFYSCHEGLYLIQVSYFSNTTLKIISLYSQSLYLPNYVQTMPLTSSLRLWIGEITCRPPSLWSEANGEDISLGLILANSPLLNDVWNRWSVVRPYRLPSASPEDEEPQYKVQRKQYRYHP